MLGYISMVPEWLFGLIGGVGLASFSPYIAGFFNERRTNNKEKLRSARIMRSELAAVLEYIQLLRQTSIDDNSIQDGDFERIQMLGGACSRTRQYFHEFAASWDNHSDVDLVRRTIDQLILEVDRAEYRHKEYLSAINEELNGVVSARALECERLSMQAIRKISDLNDSVSIILKKLDYIQNWVGD